jgi:hypothetical protein
VILLTKTTCRNPSLGLATKARAYKGEGQEGSSRITSHAPESVGVSQPHFGLSVKVKPTLPKVGTWSSGTPKNSKLMLKSQNTSHWGVLCVIGKVFKCRCLNWPRIGHLDIYSPRYGQKKGRESNWQFDSRPLNVGNRPFPDIRFESATGSWKDLDEGYNFDSDLVAIGLFSREL